MQTGLVKEAGCTGLSESTCSVTGLPAGTSNEAREREQRGGRRMVGDTRRKTGGTGLVFFSLSLSRFRFNLACGGTHRLQARWQSWLACFVQKQQRPRQCRIRPYRNPHSLKPGPHPHSLQQSDTQPQPTALDTPGRGSRPASDGICKWFIAFCLKIGPHGQVLPSWDNADGIKFPPL